MCQVAGAKANSLLGNPRHYLLLAEHNRTRDPAVFAELRKQMKEPDDPFIQNVVVPHMKRMRARVAGLPYP